MKGLKISKRLLLIIGIGVFAVLLFTLYRGYSQTTDEQNQLSAQLTLAKSRLAGLNLEQLSSQQAELEEQLGQATSEVEVVKAMLPQPVGGTEPDEIFFNVAKANGLKVTEVTLTGPNKDTLGGVTCSTILLNAKVEGNLPNLVSFITKLKSLVVNGVVKSVEITMSPWVAEPAPNIKLRLLNGQTIFLSELKGSPVLLNFWTTWSPDCSDQMPYIQQIYEEWSDKGLVVLTINVGESLYLVEEFLQTHELSVPVTLDTDSFNAQMYDIAVYPTTFFIDRDGMIQEKMVGAFESKEAIEEYLGNIIGDSEPPSGQKATADIQMAIYTYQGD